MEQNDINLSINSEIFNGFRNDIDTILCRTVWNMKDKKSSEATITVKLEISLNDVYDDTYNCGSDATVTQFKHSVSSVMQVKDKKSGITAGDFVLVFDEANHKYVLRYIDNGQINLFDNEESPVKFEHLKEYIGEDITIYEANGEYFVTTIDGRMLMTSAADADSIYYCPAEKLKDHVGHKAVCVGYGEDEIVNVSIECEDCNQVIFDVDAPEEYTYDAPEE